jgi:hypothetical protein
VWPLWRAPFNDEAWKLFGAEIGGDPDDLLMDWL